MHMYQGKESGNCTLILFYEGMEKDVGITVFQLFFVDKDLQFIQMFILAWEQDV